MVRPIQRTTAVFLALALAACKGSGPEPHPSVSAQPPAPETPSASNAWESAPPPTVSAAPSAVPVDPTANDDERAGPYALIDLHVDTPYQVFMKGRDVSLPEGHARPEDLVAGGYSGIVYPLYIPDYLHDNNPTVADAEDILRTTQRIIDANEELHLAAPHATTPTSSDGVMVFLAIEGAGAFHEDVNAIDSFITRGIRFVGPVHAHDNDLATSATGPVGDKRGLSELGKSFCRRVYTQGALIDVSHMSDEAFADLAEIANEVGAPIVATHSNARKLADHPRNLTDEQLKIIAESGGVVGLNLHGGFLRRGKAPTMEDAVRHVLHMVDVMGIDHVALGSDFDGGNPPTDFDNARAFPRFAERLLEAGLSPREVRKVFLRNVERVLRWRAPDGGGE